MNKSRRIRWRLLWFDIAFYLATCVFMYVIYPTTIYRMNYKIAIGYTLFGAACIFVPRMLFGIYRRIWRYASASDYLTLVISDTIGGVVFILARYSVPVMITFVRAVSVICLNLLGASACGWSTRSSIWSETAIQGSKGCSFASSMC